LENAKPVEAKMILISTATVIFMCFFTNSTSLFLLSGKINISALLIATALLLSCITRMIDIPQWAQNQTTFVNWAEPFDYFSLIGDTVWQHPSCKCYPCLRPTVFVIVYRWGWKLVKWFFWALLVHKSSKRFLTIHVNYLISEDMSSLQSQQLSHRRNEMIQKQVSTLQSDNA